MINVTRLRAGQTLNEYSGELESGDWGEPLIANYTAFGIAPDNSTASWSTDRVEKEQAWVVYFWKSQPDIRKDDRLRIQGRTFQVAQAPELWNNEFKASRPIVGAVVRVTLLAEES